MRLSGQEFALNRKGSQTCVMLHLVKYSTVFDKVRHANHRNH